jgi:hypothetical protein
VFRGAGKRQTKRNAALAVAVLAGCVLLKLQLQQLLLGSL